MTKKSEGSDYVSVSDEAENLINTTITRIYGLLDVTPDFQGGSYKKTYDDEFYAAAQEFDVPFALLKAHAIKESSLNAKAWRDENPSKRTDRTDWQSRGLMQLLWANDKNNPEAKNKLYDRFKKYGYSGDAIAATKGELLYDPRVNARIAAQLIKDNLVSTSGNLRDAINMYNTGKTEAKSPAPGQYVDKVVGYYNTMLGA